MKKIIRRFIKGIQFGCGRCHHDYFYHIENETNNPKDCDKCKCKAYSVERVKWWKVLFNIYD